MEYYWALKNDIYRQADGIWKNGWGNLGTEKQTMHIMPHMWILTWNLLIWSQMESRKGPLW